MPDPLNVRIPHKYARRNLRRYWFVIDHETGHVQTFDAKKDALVLAHALDFDCFEYNAMEPIRNGQEACHIEVVHRRQRAAIPGSAANGREVNHDEGGNHQGPIP